MITSISMGLSMLLLVAAAPSAEDLYRKGEALYQQGKLKQANDNFRKVIKALQDRQKKLKANTMPWNLMEFGQLNSLFYVSQILWKGKRQRMSCRIYQRVLKRLDKLPKGWENWQVQVTARERLKQAKANFKTQCGPVPSIVQLTFVPANATVKQFVKGKWVVVKATPNAEGKRTFQLQQTPKLKLQISAKDFITQEKTFTVPQWSKQQVSMTLKAKPKPKRVAVVRRLPPPKPPPPVPVTKKGWFWAVIGIGGAAVIGGGIAAIVVSQQPVQEGLRDSPDKPGFSLW